MIYLQYLRKRHHLIQSPNQEKRILKYWQVLFKPHLINNSPHELHKIFQRSNLKFNCSCMKNMKTMVNNHELADSTMWNCRNKNKCLISGGGLYQNIEYNGKITYRKPQYQGKVYLVLLKHPITLFSMGFFGAAREWRGAKRPPLPKIFHISYNDETWHSYTLPKENPKTIWITCHTPWVLLTSAFFHQKSANFAISRNTDIDCILIHNF